MSGFPGFVTPAVALMELKAEFVALGGSAPRATAVVAAGAGAEDHMKPGSPPAGPGPASLATALFLHFQRMVFLTAQLSSK